MKSDAFHIGATAPSPSADAYTDLQGLQRLRNNPDKDQALKQVAQQFESMFINLLLKNMRQANAVFEQDSLFNNSESNMIRDMYDNQLSLNMAHGKGTGLAEALYRQMSGQYSLQPGTPAGDVDTSEDDMLIENWRRFRESLIQEPDTQVPADSRATDVKQAAEANKQAQRAALAESPADFIQKMMPHAQAAAKALGLEPAVLLAQAALETGWGQKVLADAQGDNTFNLFNIKASADWQGRAVNLQALEYNNGIAVQESSRFKAYDNIAQSFEDFVALLQSQPRYAGALANTGDAETFVTELHNAGYATDPHYADKLLALYRDINQADATSTTSAAAESHNNGVRASVSKQG